MDRNLSRAPRCCACAKPHGPLLPEEGAHNHRRSVDRLFAWHGVKKRLGFGQGRAAPRATRSTPWNLPEESGLLFASGACGKYGVPEPVRERVPMCGDGQVLSPSRRLATFYGNGKQHNQVYPVILFLTHNRRSKFRSTSQERKKRAPTITYSLPNDI